MDGTDVVGDIKPNHVLLFAEDAANQPKDKGSLIQKGTTMTAPDTPVENAGRTLSAPNASELGGILKALHTFMKRATGQDPLSSDPAISGEVMEAGKVRDFETVNPDTGVTGADTNVPKLPAASGKPITPAGNDLPQPPTPGKQDEPFNQIPAGGPYAPARNKTEQVDTMTVETEALNQKVVAITVELAQKDALIKEKDANIASLTARLVQKEEDFKTAADILAEKDAELATAKDETKAAKDELANVEKKADDEEFEKFIKELPAGETDKEEKIANMRKLWDTDPKALANKAIGMVNAVKMPVTRSEGRAIVPATGVANQTKRTLGKFNQKTNQWEDDLPTQ